MANSRWTDFLQSHLFWAMDVSQIQGVPVFTPSFGFSGITAPRMTAELESFKDGTFNYSRHVVKGASVNPITFTRAASLYDSDFYDWIYYAINGTTNAKDISVGSVSFQLGNSGGAVRRTLMIIHFAKINLGPSVSSVLTSDPILTSVIENVGGSIATGGLQIGPFQYATWLPARAWLLHDVLPIEYAAGSDFDASSSAISLMNLTVQPEWIEEYSFLAGVNPLQLL